MGRIVIVDDTNSVRLTNQRILENQGHTVFGFCEPTWALYRWAEIQPVDVVISDIQMPDIEGPELITQLRAIDGTAVYLGTTGYATPTQTADMYRAGAKLIIPKPCKFDVLSELVDYCINNSQRVISGEDDIAKKFEARLHYPLRCER